MKTFGHGIGYLMSGEYGKLCDSGDCWMERGKWLWVRKEDWTLGIYFIALFC